MRVAPLLLVVIVAASAAAQPALQPALEFGGPTPGAAETPTEGSVTITWTIRNTGNVDASVELSAPIAPEGWLVREFGPRTFDLAAGAAPQTIRLVLGAQSGAAPGPVSFTAVPRNPAGQAAPAVPAPPAQVQWLAPAPPAPPVPPADHTLAYAGAAFVLVLAGGMAIAWTGRVRLHPRPAIQTAVPGSPAMYGVSVRNASRRERRIWLRIRDVPPGWSAAFSYPFVDVGPGQTLTIPLCVQPPLAPLQASNARLRLQARSRRWSLWGPSVRVETVTPDPAGAWQRSGAGAGTAPAGARGTPGTALR